MSQLERMWAAFYEEDVRGMIGGAEGDEVLAFNWRLPPFS